MYRQNPPVAKPSKSVFDPFNSSATGHQRAENRLGASVSWRESRNRKLYEQFQAGREGGKRLSDTVGAGSIHFGKDGRTANGGWVRGAIGLRENGQKSMTEVGFTFQKGVDNAAEKVPVHEVQPTKIVNPFTPFTREDGEVRESSWPCGGQSITTSLPAEGDSVTSVNPKRTDMSSRVGKPPAIPSRRIFDNLIIYLNGSTAPVISDHKLKQMLSENGARLSIALGRRSVTHVIIGKPSSNGGFGGGLASNKIQKEIGRVGGKGIRYVSVDWVLESIKAGRRLPESHFEALRLAPHGVGSVAAKFKLRNVKQPQNGTG